MDTTGVSGTEATPMDANTETLLRFRDVRAITGLRPHTLTRRLQRAGVDYFVDTHDKRQRMIDVRDLPRLIAPEPVKKHVAKVAA
jgi:hypothetical protein